MRGYSILRPLLLLAIAVLTNFSVTSICILFGMDKESAESLGMIAMILAALYTFTRMRKKRR